MKPGLHSLLRVIAVLSALAMLTGYVCFRQKIGPFANDHSVVVFPDAPASPTAFTTTKSGPVMVPFGTPSTLNRVDDDAHKEFLKEIAEGWESPPAVMGSTKIGAVVMPPPRPDDGKNIEGASIDELIEKATNGEFVTFEEVEKPTIFISTKRIEMPVFNVKKNNEKFEETPLEKTNQHVPATQSPSSKVSDLAGIRIDLDGKIEFGEGAASDPAGQLLETPEWLKKNSPISFEPQNKQAEEKEPEPVLEPKIRIGGGTKSLVPIFSPEEKPKPKK